MKNLISALILVASSMVAGQRPSFAGLSPIGFPILENRTTTTPDPLGNRFGEGNTLPIEANGDWDLVDRLSKLPIDKQPFWFINWQAYDKHRKEPQTYPQRPSSFAESANTNNGQANTQFSTQTNPGFVTPGNNELLNRFDPTTSSNQPNNNFNNNFTNQPSSNFNNNFSNQPSSNFNNNFNRTQTVNPISNIYPTSDVYQNTNSNSYPNSNNNVYPNTNNNVYPNTNSNGYPNSNTNSNSYPGSNSNWNVQVTGNTYPNLLPNGSTNSNSFSNGNPNSLPTANSNLNVYPNVNVNPSNYPAPNTNSNQFQTSNTNSNPSIGNRFGDFIQTTQKYQWTPSSSTTKVVPTNYNNNPQYNTRTDNYQQRPEYAFY